MQHRQDEEPLLKNFLVHTPLGKRPLALMDSPPASDLSAKTPCSKVLKRKSLAEITTELLTGLKRARKRRKIMMTHLQKVRRRAVVMVIEKKRHPFGKKAKAKDK
jgi:hypothetical protein